MVVTREIIDALRPDHDRTSCSDQNRQNGIAGRRFPRCLRCALLDELETPGELAHKQFQLSLSIQRALFAYGAPCPRCKAGGDTTRGPSFCGNCGFQLNGDEEP